MKKLINLFFRIKNPGYEKLHLWFGLSYAGWLIIPRVLMMQMPDEWQSKMADLLNEWDETWDFSSLNYSTHVSFKNENKKFCKIPDELCNYRHPNYSYIESLKQKRG